MEIKFFKMGIYLLFIFSFFNAVFADLDHILISEVVYNPLTTESGGEAVQLFNPTKEIINLSGYILKTQTSDVDVTLPLGAFIQPHGYYLIADAGWTSYKDNNSFSNADYEEAFTLTNTNGGVALLFNGTVLDILGWGNTSLIGKNLYEGNPALEIKEGMSLKRNDLFQEKNNNSFDFIESYPQLFNSSSFFKDNPTDSYLNNLSENNLVSLKVNINNQVPTLNFTRFNNNFSLTSLQVFPFPGMQRIINFSFVVQDLNGIEDLNNITLFVRGPRNYSKVLFVSSEDSLVYKESFSLAYYDEPGTYTIFATIFDQGGLSTSQNLSFEYLPMTALFLDTTTLSFGNVSLGKETVLLGDDLLDTTDAPTLRNIGNTNISLFLSGTDLKKDNKTIGVSNLTYAFENDFEGDYSGVLSLQFQRLAFSFVSGADSSLALGFKLFVPKTAANGEYVGTVKIVAVKA